MSWQLRLTLMPEAAKNLLEESMHGAAGRVARQAARNDERALRRGAACNATTHSLFVVVAHRAMVRDEPGTPAVPGKDLPLQAVEEMAQAVLAVPGVARVALDISPKPPATTEWE